MIWKPMVDDGVVTFSPAFKILRWWRVDPGAAVFVPKGNAHSWSSGNTTGLSMIWIYGGHGRRPVAYGT